MLGIGRCSNAGGGEGRSNTPPVGVVRGVINSVCVGGGGQGQYDTLTQMLRVKREHEPSMLHSATLNKNTPDYQ